MTSEDTQSQPLTREDLIGSYLLMAAASDPLGTKGGVTRGPADVLLLHEEGSYLLVHAWSGFHVQQEAGRWRFADGQLLLEGVLVELVSPTGVHDPRPTRRALPAWRVNGRTYLGNAGQCFAQHGGRVIPDLGHVTGYTRVDGSTTLLPRKWENVPIIARHLLGQAGDAGLGLDLEDDTA